MPKLLKNKEVVSDQWTLLRTAEEVDAQGTDNHCIVPLDIYLARHSDLDAETTGVLLPSDADLAEIRPYLDSVPVIAIDFPAFTDGRGFSLARTLRENLDYEGEIRAVGSFIPDQLFYLTRCGFDAFLVDDDVDTDELLPLFDTFTERYQAGADEPQPLFRRRA